MNTSSLTEARFEFLKNSRLLSPATRETILNFFEEELGYPAPPSLYGELEDLPIDAKPVGPLPNFQKRGKPVKIALCLGHARPNDRGARAVTGDYEESYNLEIINGVSKLLKKRGHTVLVFDRYVGSSYGRAMRWIAERLKKEKVDMGFEFHFNAASPDAEGFETLFWHKSQKGVIAAKAIQETHAKNFGWQKNRRVEPLGDQAHERGVLFTSLTHCPSGILEPFFGSNKRETEFFMSLRGKSELIASNAEGIDEAARRLFQS